MNNREKVLSGDECLRCSAPMVGHGCIQVCVCCDTELPLPDDVDQVNCPLCFKPVRAGGIADHINDVHGVVSSDTSKLYE